VFELPVIDPRIPASLRPLRLLCAVLAACVALFSIVPWVVLEGLAVRPLPGVPGAVTVSMTVFAMILLLLSSRLRTNILRKSIPATPGLPLSLERLLEGYRRGTLVSFALLEFAALVGLFVALLSGTAFYGIALGAASLISMATRWPRDTDVDRIARGRRSP
jgi:hypothetical protein